MENELFNKFGPHTAYQLDDQERIDRGILTEKLVKTHCCFCGQQCGMQLKVHENKIIGIEPWEEFPFNKGMLCPKGVKRYLQNSHPDRLLHAYAKDTSVPEGFRQMGYEEAIGRVASEIQKIQSQHGHDAFAVLTGASLTTEKTYLMGKFARLSLKTSNIDYNGRLCMVSAGAACKKAFGIDRSANPWEDIPKAQVIWLAGSNVAECSPITTEYIWAAREKGAKIIVVDPRITPIARTCDLYLPVRPGRDIVLFNGVLNIMIQNHWIDEDFIKNHTVGFESVKEHVAQWTLEKTAKETGIEPKSIMKAAELWGEAKTSFMLHARGIEHHSHGVENCLGSINLVLASGRIGREGCGYAMITGQANGQGGREHGQKCDQLPGNRDIENQEHREYIAKVWGVDEKDIPRKGVDAYEIIRKIDRGEVKGLLSICFNPLVSLPDSNYVRAMLEKLDFYVAIDFFMSETSRYADIILPGSLQEEDEGTVTQVEGRVIKINKVVDCPGEARQDWIIIQDIARALGRDHGLQFSGPREIFEELRVASKGGLSDYYGITWEKIEKQMGVFWPCPSLDHPGTPRLFEPGSFNSVAQGKGPFYFPDGKARFNVAQYSPPKEVTDKDYPIILTTGRVVSQFLSGNQTRRIGPLNDQCPDPFVEIHPKLAEHFGIKNNDMVLVESRRGKALFKALVVKTIRPDTVFVPYHWGGKKSINMLTISAQDPISKIPEYKVCAVKISKANLAEVTL